MRRAKLLPCLALQHLVVVLPLLQPHLLHFLQLPLLAFQLLPPEQIINIFFQLPLRLVLSGQLLLLGEILLETIQIQLLTQYPWPRAELDRHPTRMASF